MATLNPFDLLGDENEDPAAIAAAAAPAVVKAPAAEAKAATKGERDAQASDDERVDAPLLPRPP